MLPGMPRFWPVPASDRSLTQGIAARPLGHARNRIAEEGVGLPFDAEFALHAERNFLSRIKLIWVVQSPCEKYFDSLPRQITSRSRAFRPDGGAYRDRHERGAGCDGRGQRF